MVLFFGAVLLDNLTPEYLERILDDGVVFLRGGFLRCRGLRLKLGFLGKELKLQAYFSGQHFRRDLLKEALVFLLFHLVDLEPGPLEFNNKNVAGTVQKPPMDEDCGQARLFSLYRAYDTAPGVSRGRACACR